MLTRQDALDQIDWEKKSFKRRKWLKNEWTEKNREKIEKDLDRQRKKVESKTDDFFEDYEDVYDALDAIEDEIDSENKRNK